MFRLTEAFNSLEAYSLRTVAASWDGIHISWNKTTKQKLSF